MNSKEQSAIVRILLQDSQILKRRPQLVDALEISKVTQLDYAFRNGTISTHELYRRILERWVQQNKDQGTIDKFVDILKHEDFNWVADAISKYFDNPHQLSQDFTQDTPFGSCSYQSFDKSHPIHFPESHCPSYTTLNQRGLKLLNKIDMGAYGTVYHAAHDEFAEQNYAVKEISIGNFIRETARSRRRQRNGQSYLFRVLREVRAMAKLSDTTNVVRYFDSWFDGPLAEGFEESIAPSVMEEGSGGRTKKFTYEFDGNGQLFLPDGIDKTFLLIKMERCTENLQQWMNTQKYLRFDIGCDILHQLLNGLSSIHKIGIIHRDLKPNNILVLPNPNRISKLTVKIGDFGIARDFHTSQDSQITSKIGCETFRSPEMANGLPYGFKTDVYSLGLIFLLLIHEFEDDEDRFITFYSLRKRKRRENALAEVEKSLGVKTLPELRSLLEINPELRPTAEEMLMILKKQRKNEVTQEEIKKLIFKQGFNDRNSHCWERINNSG